MKRIVKKTLNLIFAAFCVAACAMISVVAYSKITGKTVIPYSVMWVLTDSMEETIPAKSYILVKKADPGEVRVGDVITFRSREAAIQGNLNTHRVIEIVGDNEEFVTKGDNSATQDSKHVFPEDVVAVYVRNMPVLTFFGRIFTSNAGFIACILLILAGTVFWLCRYIMQNREKTDKKEFDRLVEEEIERLRKQDESRRADEDVRDGQKNDSKKE
ncbi:MAG: signal peptidase I [Candidatus Borkfalkiaceae bacterium]|nr:signal peptidase I [Clostridia bacterium]MDY6222569.1 signal peptidase I [Christensenellaceae bacterium]